MKHPSRPRLVTATFFSAALLAASTGGTLAANPCAAKNPCAAENPCAAKNPCAAENPCAAK